MDLRVEESPRRIKKPVIFKGEVAPEPQVEPVAPQPMLPVPSNVVAPALPQSPQPRALEEDLEQEAPKQDPALDAAIKWNIERYKKRQICPLSIGLLLVAAVIFMQISLLALFKTDRMFV